MLLILTLVIAWISYFIGMYTADKFYNFGNTEGVSEANDKSGVLHDLP